MRKILLLAILGLAVVIHAADLKPNTPVNTGQSKSCPHHNFLVSVDQIEAETGLDFLAVLPDSAESQIEAKKTDIIWQPK